MYYKEAVEKVRCTLPLTNLSPRLARCSVSLRPLWVYDSGENHPEGPGLDGLTEQSAKL